MTPEQIQTAVTMRATGASYKSISQATGGLNTGTIYHKLHKDEINQLIKKEQARLIRDGLSIAIDNQINKIRLSQKITAQIDNGEDLKSGAVKALELGHDCEKQILQSVGIHNAHTQSITLNQILVDNRSELSPAVEKMLISHLGGKAQVEGKVIEADIIDIQEQTTSNEAISA